MLKVKDFAWFFAALLAILIHGFLAEYPELAEYGYSRGVFPWVRTGLDFSLGWLPFPMIYVLVPLWCLLFLTILFRAFWQSKGRWRYAWPRLLSVFSAPVVFFYLLWGFNYRRQPVEKLLGLETIPLSIEDICEALEWETTRLQVLSEQVRDTLPPKDLEDMLRKNLYEWSRVNDLPVAGKVRAYLIFPRGVFMRFSSSGLYFPFSGQGQVDAGLHPLDLPSVMTHEMAHGLGYGDEGTCNFLAYMATTSSDNAFIRYAGHLSYWRQLAAFYRRYRPEDFQRIVSLLPQQTIYHLEAIYAVLDRYPDIFPGFRNLLYNGYLKSQGISEGVQNYNRILMLTHAWYQKYGYDLNKPTR
jgi:hypothetical protein